LPKLVEALHRDEILHLQEVVRRVPAAPSVIHYALELVRLTRPVMSQAKSPSDGNGKSRGDGHASPKALPLIDRLVTFGAGPRAVQFLLLGGKARAVMQGRKFVSIDDIRALAHAVLRHRIITNFAAEAENYDADAIIDHVLEAFPPRQIDELRDAGVEKVFGS
jgi:MoxR-like ATPase